MRLSGVGRAGRSTTSSSFTTRNVTWREGKLVNTRQQPAEGWVILFAADESRWASQSRYVRAMRARQDGKFQMNPVPHDDYLIAAVADVQDGQWQDPDFLRVLKTVATRIAIGEGEAKVQDVLVEPLR